MGSFNGFLDAEFRPPRNWSLISSLKFKSETLTREQRDLLVECGIQVTKQQAQLQFQKDTLQTWHQFLESVGHS